MMLRTNCFVGVVLLTLGLVSGCVEFEKSGARKAAFRFFVTDAVRPVVAEGEILSIVSHNAGKVRLGTGCLDNQGELDTFLTLATTGHIYEIAAQGLPNNGSLLMRARFLDTCIAEDGSSWRRYAADLDKP
jgi:hypothetical protein